MQNNNLNKYLTAVLLAALLSGCCTPQQKTQQPDSIPAVLYNSDRTAVAESEQQTRERLRQSKAALEALIQNPAWEDCRREEVCR